MQQFEELLIRHLRLSYRFARPCSAWKLPAHMCYGVYNNTREFGNVMLNLTQKFNIYWCFKFPFFLIDK